MRLRIALFVVFSAAILGPALAQASVHIPDPNLRAAVEEALWLYDPTPADMLGLRKLSCFNRGVRDITGLEYAENLQSLNLHLNRLHDISPLSGLDHLQKLDLSRNQIDDLSALSDMSQLRYLNLHGNQICDVSVLAELTNLEDLVLRLNQISDIAALAGLTQLTRLPGRMVTPIIQRLISEAPWPGMSRSRSMMAMVSYPNTASVRCGSLVIPVLLKAT